MKRAVAYCRFSSSNQREESIDAQIRAIKEYCDKNKLKLCYILYKYNYDEWKLINFEVFDDATQPVPSRRTNSAPAPSTDEGEHQEDR